MKTSDRMEDGRTTPFVKFNSNNGLPNNARLWDIFLSGVAEFIGMTLFVYLGTSWHSTPLTVNALRAGIDSFLWSQRRKIGVDIYLI